MVISQINCVDSSHFRVADRGPCYCPPESQNQLQTLKLQKNDVNLLTADWRLLTLFSDLVDDLHPPLKSLLVHRDEIVVALGE